MSALEADVVHEAGISSLPMLLVPVLAAGAALLRERRTGTPALILVVAAASVVAAAVHALVAPEHFAESALYGWFFVTTAVAGIGYALWVVLRPSRWLLVSGAAANAAIVGLWLFTRLVVVPVGPGAGEAEAFGAMDVLASCAELVTLAAALLAVTGAVNVAAAPARRTVSSSASRAGSASTAAGEAVRAVT